MGMTKKVAAAIRDNSDVFPLGDNREYLSEEDALTLARAAIEAMRPLPSDIAEGLAEHFDNDITRGTARKVTALWDDAIGAALADSDSKTTP